MPQPIPGYPKYQDLKGDSRYKRLTARLVLSHQSGLTNSRYDHPEHRLTFELDPKKTFRYSEEGYRLLQFVLEQRFGRSLNDLADIVVFSRLSMRDTRFIPDSRIQKHLVAPKEADTREGLTTGVPESLYTNPKDYNQFVWDVLIKGGTLDLQICAPYFRPEVRVQSPSILEPPLPGKNQTLPGQLSWCLGWGTYKILQSQAYFIGQRFEGIECFAFASLMHRTAVTIFIVGNEHPSSMAGIFKAIMGDVETPLTWLGFK